MIPFVHSKPGASLYGFLWVVVDGLKIFSIRSLIQQKDWKNILIWSAWNVVPMLAAFYSVWIWLRSSRKREYIPWSLLMLIAIAILVASEAWSPWGLRDLLWTMYIDQSWTFQALKSWLTRSILEATLNIPFNIMTVITILILAVDHIVFFGCCCSGGRAKEVAEGRLAPMNNPAQQYHAVPQQRKQQNYVRPQQSVRQPSYRPPASRGTPRQQGIDAAVMGIASMQAYIRADNAAQARIVQDLKRIRPSGGTALYDAIMMGLSNVLHHHLIFAGMAEGEGGGAPLPYKFIQIILTDGADTSSKPSAWDAVRDIMGRMQGLGDLCRTVLIGVGVSGEADQRLKILARLGGNSCDYINEHDIESVFNRLELTLGIRRDIALIENEHGALLIGQESHQVHVDVNLFVVSLNLDISGSMLERGKWTQVCRSTQKLLANLTRHDWVSCAVFNNNARFITG